MISIDAASEASKNTYNPHLIGLVCEDVVAKEMIQLGFEPIAHRWKTPFAEVDLVFRNPQKQLITLIEVKSLSKGHWSRFRIGQRQKQRLKRALLWCQRQSEWSVNMRLALVQPDWSICWIDQFLS